MTPTPKPTRNDSLAPEVLTDIEDFEDADCDRLDDLMVHFEGSCWQIDSDDRAG